MACHRQAIPLYISRATMKRELRNRAAAGLYETLYAVPVAARSTADTVSVADLSELAPGVPDGTGSTGSTGASLLHADLVCKLENPVPHSSRLVRVGGDRD